MLKVFVKKIILKIFFTTVVKQHFYKIISEFIVDNNKTLFSHLQHTKDTLPKNNVVYTCIVGDYDSLILHHYVNDKCDYVCFTDNKHLVSMKQFGVWKIKPLQFSELDNTRNARWHKTHPHILFPEYDCSLWVDANVDVLDDYIFNEMGKTSSKLLIPLHFNRDCIYKEIESLYNLPRKESADVLDEMRIVLQNNKMPQHYGLNETNLIFRRHNDSQIINIMEEWWSFIRKISKRDQVSLSFVLWKNGLKPSDIAIPNARRIKSFFISDNHQTMIFNSQIYNWNTVSQVWKL